jgi:anti-sigma factor RsiW
VPCAEALRVQAYFDGELDALAALEIERHGEHCPECRALLESLAQTRARLRAELEFPMAPAHLRAAVARALDAEAAPAGAAGGHTAPRALAAAARRSRPFWFGAASGLGAALAAGLLLFVLLPLRSAPVLDELVGAHVRSLMPEHLTDVVSSDRHTVKPWFAGHADVSPVVVDFATQGYRLVGGRADFFEQQRVAAVVYQHGAHLINVFSWVAGRPALPEFSSRSGYHIACWRDANLQSCAVSDTGWDELQGLTRLLRERGAGAPAPE